MAIQIRVSVHSEDIAKCELLRLARLIACELSEGYPSTAIPEISEGKSYDNGTTFDISHKLVYEFK